MNVQGIFEEILITNKENKKEMGILLDKLSKELLKQIKIINMISIEEWYNILAEYTGLEPEYISDCFRIAKSKFDRQETGAIEYKKWKDVYQNRLISRVSLYLTLKSIIEKKFKKLLNDYSKEEITNGIMANFNENR